MNSLNTELEGKTVVMEGDVPERLRTVKVVGGFGASSFTSGTALFAVDCNGNDIRLDAMEVERIVEETL